MIALHYLFHRSDAVPVEETAGAVGDRDAAARLDLSWEELGRLDETSTASAD